MEMLLSETVIVKWNPNNKKYYENLGYKWTKQGDIFHVKIEDISKGTRVFVNVKCDCSDCKNPYLRPMRYDNYLKGLRNNKHYCLKCSMKLYGTENSKATQLKNSMSFEQWCIKNLSKEESSEILSRWDYILNDCNPSEISYASSKKHYFKCPKGIHESELKQICNFTSGEFGVTKCNKCNSFAQYLIDMYGKNALELYWDYDKNTINPWSISKGSTQKIWIKCQEKYYHGSYKISPNHFIQNKRCLCCSGKAVHLLDSLGTLYPQALDRWSEKNDKLPYEYAPFSMKKVWWKCECGKHEDYERSIASTNKYDFRCPECIKERDESFLQEKVRLYIEELNNRNYIILHEHKCTIIPQNPKHKGSRGQMPFDNEVKELKLIIEVMGSQHYEITGFHKKHAKRNNTTTEHELHMQQVRDRYKRIYAKSKGYEYLEIPYWTDDNEDTWKQLIDCKINEILHNKKSNIAI
jgi:hypothetical protein